MLNALKYVEELERAGFTREQAEMNIKLLIDLMNENLASKADVKELETALRSDMKGVETALRSDMKELETALRTEMKELGTELRTEMKELEWRMDGKFQSLKSDFRETEYKLIIKLGSLVTIAIGVAVTLVRLLPAAGQ